jgi:hypothetical protein
MRTEKEIRKGLELYKSLLLKQLKRSPLSKNDIERLNGGIDVFKWVLGETK